MSLTANTPLESTRRKFFMNSTYIILQSRNHLFLVSGCQNESNSHQIAGIGEKKIFHELDVNHVYKVGINCFLDSGCQNESNSQYHARIGEKKIFHELDVHHVKVGITCFWARNAKMSLTANAPLESARRKFFMNSTYIMSTK